MQRFTNKNNKTENDYMGKYYWCDYKKENFGYTKENFAYNGAFSFENKTIANPHSTECTFICIGYTDPKKGPVRSRILYSGIKESGEKTIAIAIPDEYKFNIKASCEAFIYPNTDLTIFNIELGDKVIPPGQICTFVFYEKTYLDPPKHVFEKNIRTIGSEEEREPTRSPGNNAKFRVINATNLEIDDKSGKIIESQTGIEGILTVTSESPFGDRDGLEYNVIMPIEKFGMGNKTPITVIPPRIESTGIVCQFTVGETERSEGNTYSKYVFGEDGNGGYGGLQKGKLYEIFIYKSKSGSPRFEVSVS
jgi:hypothetical protein